MNITPPSLDVARAVTCERLRLLALGYKISGIIGAVMVSFLIFHVIVLGAMSLVPESAWDKIEKNQKQAYAGIDPSSSQVTPSKKFERPPVILFRVMTAAILLIILVGWTLGGLTFYAGRCIDRRKKRLFVQVMAGVNCVWIPYGTLLGIATFVALAAPDTKAEYPG